MKLVCAGVIAFIAAHAPGLVAAEPAGPGRPRVVIDPGHGGSNTGTAAPELGILEKDVVLRLADRVRARLASRGVDVAMTRRDDRTLTLRQRMAFASLQRADVFVSIHANASPARAQRGFETFVLTPTAIDVDGRALRSALSVRDGVDPGVAAILDDVERGTSQWASAELAAAIQRELRAVRGADLDRGVRQDSHHVLLGATMPAVLVEVGFLNHPLEGRELLDPAVEERIAEAIARAIASQLGSEAGR